MLKLTQNDTYYEAYTTQISFDIKIKIRTVIKIMQKYSYAIYLQLFSQLLLYKKINKAVLLLCNIISNIFLDMG